MAGDFVSGAQQTYQQKQQVAPAVPTELNRQAAQRQADPQDDGHSFVQDAQKWYTGASNEGVTNGWDTPFVESFINGQQKAAEDGTLRDYFKNGGTGIATNDVLGSKFGDVYQDGVKVGNLYDAYDEDTADLMMADFTLDATTKANAFQAGTLHGEVTRARDNENKRVSSFEGVQKFNKEAQRIQEEISSGAGDEAIGIGGGAAGGALIGAGIGSLFGGIGALPGAAIGAVVGGIGGWLNRDEITNQIAQTEAQVNLLEQGDYGTASEITTRIQGYGGVANQLISPLTNVLHGGVDLWGGHGTAGDAGEGWYAVDPTTGESELPGIAQVAEFGTRLGDSVLLGMSSVGMLSFQATMAAQIVGQIGTLSTTGGQKFNATTGQFDNMFTTTDADGNTHFDPKAAAAGITSIGIDAVQMAAFRGLNVRAIMGSKAAVGLGLDAKVTAKQLSDDYSLFDRIAAKTGKGFAADAQRAGNRIEYEAGRKIAVNDAGEAVAMKKSLSILAPSEAIMSTQASWAARHAAVDAGAMTADDFYRAAQSLNAGSSLVKRALVNGFGEGAEESIQAFLDPYADEAPGASFGQIFQAGAFGFAMGAGLSAGSGLRTPDATQHLYMQYAVQAQLDGGKPMSFKEFTGQGKYGMRRLANRSQTATVLTDDLIAKAAHDLGEHFWGGEPAAAKLQKAAAAKELADKVGGPALNDMLTIAGHNDSFTPNEAGVISQNRLLKTLSGSLTGIKANIVELTRRVQGENPDPKDIQMLAEQQMIEVQLTAIKDFVSRSVKQIQAAREAGNRSEVHNLTEALNLYLRDAWEYRRDQVDEATGQRVVYNEDALQARARAITMLDARYPMLGGQAFQFRLPQVSVELSDYGLDGGDGGMLVSNASQKQQNSDFDGDQTQAQQTALMDWATYSKMRGGATMLSATSVDIGVREYEPTFVRNIAQALRDPRTDQWVLGAQQKAADVLDEISRRLGALLEVGSPAQLLTQDELDQIIDIFKGDIQALNKKAALNLINMLTFGPETSPSGPGFAGPGSRLVLHGESIGKNLFFAMDDIIHQEMEQFATWYAEEQHRAALIEIARKGHQPNPESAPDMVKGFRGQTTIKAATPGQTLILEGAAGTMIRMFQKLKYSAKNAHTTGAFLFEDAETGAGPIWDQMVELMRVFSQGTTSDELSQLAAHDDIAAHAQAIMKRIGAGIQSAYADNMTVLSTMLIPNINSNGDYQGGKTSQYITVAQWALREAMTAHERRNQPVIAANPDLASQYGMIRRTMLGHNQAGEAWAYIFPQSTNYEMLPLEMANVFGANASIEQTVRKLINMSTENRRELLRNYRGNLRFMGEREDNTDMPYSMDEILAGNITPYRAYLALVSQVSAGRSTVDSNGEPGGRYAKESRDIADTFIETVTEFQAALKQRARLSPFKPNSVEDVQAFLRANPAWTEQLFELVPDASANIAFPRATAADGSTVVMAANWIAEMLLMEPKQALMHYFRNVHLNNYAALTTTLDEDEQRQDDKFDDLFERKIWRMSQGDPGLFDAFIKDLLEATDLDEYIRLLNRTYRTDEPVFTAFKNDVADFSPDKKFGGWRVSVPGVQQRQAIRAWKDSTAKLNAKLKEQAEIAISDGEAITAVLEGKTAVDTAGGWTIIKDADGHSVRELPPVVLGNPLVSTYNQWTQLVDRARERVTALGPNVIQQEALFALLGFYGNSADKANPPAHTSVIGVWQMVSEAAGFTTPDRKALKRMTAYNIGDLRGNPGLIMQGGRLVLDNGEYVEWPALTADYLAEQFQNNPSARPFIKALISPQVFDLSGPVGLTMQTLAPQELKGLLQWDHYANMFRTGSEADHLYGTELVSVAEALGVSSNELMQQMNEVLISLSTAMDREITATGAGDLVNNVYRDTIRIFRQVGEFVAAGGDLTMVREALHSLVDEGFSGPNTPTEKLVRDAALDRFIAAYTAEGADRVAAIREEFGEASPELAQATEDLASATDNILAALKDRTLFDRIANDWLLPEQSASPSAAEVQALHARQVKLANYVKTRRMDVGMRVNEAFIPASIIRNSELDLAKGEIPAMSPENWDSLARAVVAVEIEDRIAGSVSGRVISAYPKAASSDAARSADMRRLYDPSFFFLADRFLQEDSPLVLAATKIHLAAKQGLNSTGPKKVARTIYNSLLNPAKYGEWHTGLVTQIIEANGRMQSGGSKVGTQAGGLAPNQVNAYNQANASTWDRPDPATLSTIIVPASTILQTPTMLGEAEGLDESLLVNVPVQTDGGIVTAQVPMPIVQIGGRYTKSVMVSYTDTAGNPIEFDLLSKRPVDPANAASSGYIDSNLGNFFTVPTNVPAGEFYQTFTIEQLQKALRGALPNSPEFYDKVRISIDFFHPASAPLGEPNNGYYLGSSTALNVTPAPSLGGETDFVPGGSNDTAQQAALDSMKNMTNAINVLNTLSQEDITTMETDWQSNLLAVMIKKANRATLVDSGTGVRPTIEYNAKHQYMLRHHLVRGFENGEPSVWPAEKVINWQLANQGNVDAKFPLEQAQLITLDEASLAALYGAENRWAAGLGLEATESVDQVKPYIGITIKDVKDRLPGLLKLSKDGKSFDSKSIFDTGVVQFMPSGKNTPRPILQPDTELAFQSNIKRIREAQVRTEQARVQDEAWNKGRDEINKRNAWETSRMLDELQTVVSFKDAGIAPFDTRNPGRAYAEEAKLQIAFEALGLDEYAMVWRHEENSSVSPARGVLSGASISGDIKASPGFNPGPQDLVVINLASFQTPAMDETATINAIENRIRYYSNLGVKIELVQDGAGGDYAAEAADMLKTLGYESVPGSNRLFTRPTTTRQHQTRAARASHAMEAVGVSTESMYLTLVAENLGIHDGQAFLTDPDQFNEISVVKNVFPTEPIDGYYMPTVPETIAKVKQTIEQMDITVLAKQVADASGMSPKDKKGRAEVKAALQQMIRSWQGADNTTLLPLHGELKPGIFVPYYNENANAILFHRYGYEAPTADNLLAQLKAQEDPVTKKRDYSTIAITSYTSKPIGSQATIFTGTLVDIKPKVGFGYDLTVRVPLKSLFAKFIGEGTGAKKILVPLPANKQLPKAPPFEKNPIQVITDDASQLDKDSVKYLMRDHRTVFLGLGVDFIPALAKTLLGVDNIASLTAVEQAGIRTHLTEFLTDFGRTVNLSLDSVELLMRQSTVFKQDLQAVWDEATSLLTDMKGNVRGWLDSVTEDTLDAEAEITKAVLLYMSTEGAKPHHVLQAGGLINPQAKTDLRLQSIDMPPVFTEYFDRSTNPELQTWVLNMMNSRLNNKGGQQFYFDSSFRLHIVGDKGQPDWSGYLQFNIFHAADANVAFTEMADARRTEGNYSPTADAILQQSLGAESMRLKKPKKLEKFLNPEGVPDLSTVAGMREMLRQGTEVDSTYRPWRMRTQPERWYEQMARARNVGYRQLLNTDWDGDDAVKNKRDTFTKLRDSIAKYIGLTAEEAVVVDGWVRQHLYQSLAEDGAAGNITYENAMKALGVIQQNLKSGQLPLEGAMVPRLHYYDLQALFDRSTSGRSSFALKDKDGNALVNFEDWVDVALGGADTSKLPFHVLARLDFDSFTHTYMAAHEGLAGMKMSVSDTINQFLLGEDAQMLMSIDPGTNALLNEQVIFEGSPINLESLFSSMFFDSGIVGSIDPSVMYESRQAAITQWYHEHGLQEPRLTSVAELKARGAAYREDQVSGNVFMHVVTDLRAGFALFNPGLWVSAIGETGVRNVLDKLADALTGSSTSWAAQKLAGGDMSGFFQFTPEEMKAINAGARALGSNSKWKERAYSSQLYKQRRLDSAGRIEKTIALLPKFGSRMQDPQHRLRADMMADRYLKAVLQGMNAMPNQNIITPGTLIQQLQLDPYWLAKKAPMLDKLGIAAMENTRSIKPTAINIALKGFMDPLTNNPSGTIAMASTLGLKLPLMFAGYGANVATNITGMQGPMAVTAMFLDGRKNWFKKWRSFASNSDYDPTVDDTMDFSAALDSIDLSREFVKGGITHTALFAFALMAGSLGLSGEDPEDKRRRKAATYQGAGYVYDPRKIENDFRNADAIYLDSIPILGNFFRVTTEDGTERSMMQPHWMIRQFTSPILGMEKFMETGDWRHVTWGFGDAFSAFPLINAGTINQAFRAADELRQSAEDHSMAGTPEDMGDAFYFALGVVSTYESMLLESSFINSFYQAKDKYDRDPWVLPQTDSEGNVVRNELGQPQDTKALQSYLDENGEIKQGYVTRDWLDANLHQWGENKATFALLASLFTGQGVSGSYNRENMAVKTREVEKTELTQDEAEALILKAYADEGGLTSLKEGSDESKLIMSFVAGDGGEHLTEDGARAVFDGLWHGTVNFDDASLEGVYIPREMREAIQEKWMDELVQQSIDKGLDQKTALNMMYDVWNGPDTNPYAIGLREILWSNEISYQPKALYAQLNTTYILGPDGKPWATGVQRNALTAAFGFPGGQQYYQGEIGNMGVDRRLNSVDAVNNTNTGLRALQKVDESWEIPTDEEIGKSIVDAINKMANKQYQPTAYGSGGGGGGGYGSRMYSPVSNQVPYAPSTNPINGSNPYVRRAQTRRERITSDRGRLKQWQ